MSGLRDLFFREAFDNTANLRSGADILRPPYTSGLKWVTPATPGAAVSLEQALQMMPPVYRSAMERSSGPEVVAGSMQSGLWNVAGLYNRNLSTGLRRLVGEDAKTFVHELVHALVDQKKVGLAHNIEEELARVVAGDPPTHHLDRGAAEKLDQFVRNPPGGLSRFFWNHGPLLKAADRIRE